MRLRALLPALLAFLLAASAALSVQRKPKEDPNIRSVQGVVRAPDDSVVEGAIVQLKDTKTLQVRSFVTLEDGTYYFQGLRTNIDYELRAERRGAASPVKTLSVYDSRKKAIINLKLESKQ